MEISERDEVLKLKYPKILKDLGGDPRKTSMSAEHGGINIGDGWIPLLEKIMNFCQYHHDINGYPQLVADQIKEKFGTLNFYYHFEECDSIAAKIGKKYNRSSEMLVGAISFAEGLSHSICETCGAPGTRYEDSWIRTRCTECREKNPW